LDNALSCFVICVKRPPIRFDLVFQTTRHVHSTSSGGSWWSWHSLALPSSSSSSPFCASPSEIKLTRTKVHGTLSPALCSNSYGHVDGEMILCVFMAFLMISKISFVIIDLHGGLWWLFLLVALLFQMHLPLFELIDRHGQFQPGWASFSSSIHK